MKPYKQTDRYNLDECALFYKLAPNRTLASGRVEGLKNNKERLTVAVIVNETGDHYTKPIVIGKTRKPRCFGIFLFYWKLHYLSLN